MLHGPVVVAKVFRFRISPKNLKWISLYISKLLQNQSLHSLFASQLSDASGRFVAENADFIVLLTFITEPFQIFRFH
jgi:hypothetical protein